MEYTGERRGYLEQESANSVIYQSEGREHEIEIPLRLDDSRLIDKVNPEKAE